MPAEPRMSIADALFGDLPDGVRQRYGLDRPAGTEANGAARTDAIRERKARTRPGRDGGPTSPWHLSRASWIEAAKRVWHEIGADRVTSVSGGVTFFALLALFPALTALVSIYGLFADRDTIAVTLDTLNRFVPEGAMGLIRDQIISIADAPPGALGLATIIGLLTALWSANGGVKAVLEALNIAWYQKEGRGFFKLNLVALGFTLGGIALICLMVALIAVLPRLSETLSLGPVVDGLIGLLRWPVMLGVLMAAVSALYRWGPDKDDPAWHWISPGAVFATVGLIAASALFSWYASSFANYNKTYGSLGAVIGLMMWLWISTMVVMVGAEINSELERQVQKENGIPLEGADAKQQGDPATA